MKTTKHVLTLKIPVSVYADEFSDQALTTAKKSLERTGYDEGRYPFQREMFIEGLRGLLNEAAHDSVKAVHMAEHDRLKSEGVHPDLVAGAYGRAVTHADLWVKRNHVLPSPDGWCVEIRQTPDDTLDASPTFAVLQRCLSYLKQSGASGWDRDFLITELEALLEISK